jgi:hypothetical protein
MRMVGRALVIGVAGTTTPVEADVAVALPLWLRAVTSIRTRKPTSAVRTP